MLGFIEFIDLLSEEDLTEAERFALHKAKVIRGNPDLQGAQIVSRAVNPMAKPHRSEKVHKVALNKLTLNEPGKLDGEHSDEAEEHVATMSHQVKRGIHQEPITLMHKAGKLHVIDGHHRLEAYRRAGAKHIPARIMGGQGQRIDYVKNIED